MVSGCPLAHQVVAFAMQIGECTGDEQAVGILGEAAIAHTGKVEDALDGQERVFALGPDF